MGEDKHLKNEVQNVRDTCNNQNLNNPTLKDSNINLRSEFGTL